MSEHDSGTDRDADAAPAAAGPCTELPEGWAYDAEASGIGVLPVDMFRSIGKPVKRREDRRLVTGKGRFTDDFSVAGQLYAAMVRSPYPHARIRAIDTAAAQEAPGVLAVLTGQDALDDGLGPIPHNPVPSTRFDVKLRAPDGAMPFIGPHLLLPVDKARHVGEAVAMVVAESRAAAEDAAELVEVDWEELPHVADSLDAMAPGAPQVWDEVPGNAFVDSAFGDEAAVDAAFAEAAHVASAKFHVNRVTAVTMEPRAALADYDPETGRSTLYAGSGGAVRQKRELAETLGLDPADLRVLSHDVGGNFGARNRVYVEFGLVLWASRRLQRPVKFTATRSESFLTDYQGRDLNTHVQLALDADGRFLAMKADNVSNVGARCVSLSPLSKGSGLITGSYHIPHAHLRARAVFTNTMCTQAYRSSGRPEVTYAIERLVDIAAEEMGLDKIELRRRNLVAPTDMPYRTAMGSIYDSGEYEANMDRAMALFEWDAIPARHADAEARGKRLGVGLANYVESSIGTPKERAEITVAPGGQVEVVIGTQPSGQGHETSFAQVVADMLQTPVERVRIVLGDTDKVSLGGGTHSGRSMRHAGTVMAMASADLLRKARTLAADRLGFPPEELDFTDGAFSHRDSNQTVTLAELATADAPLFAARTNEMHAPVFPNGTAICEVEIDPDTCRIEITRYASIDDVGRCINPMIVHGQSHGGIAQGVGQAMWENCPIDAESGQPLAGSLMDYGMPRADNVPFYDVGISEVLSPTNPFGVKAGGEGGTTPALATVTLAVLDALRPLGVRDISMPVTPERLWQALHAAPQATESRT
ncbi:possible carbon-monoxide dehydrogenase large subunit [Oceanicola granulosus HTCC2516]|uniref:Possible carbon-monoxide dehydrogenase large subunit n=1 Tax=Oceanicola granulosus (strain ATCC BAA-861 / DSM 15982 / KCTC 12143 / HTCC2516) TaxID=314256 RepID=Q2CGN7_OCEGH|nr:xanthine dehydrogenase family protein molybdopterin-binding subunit [Oceanicola granulosus]EAR51898.1 possible carbon-monoxide dehydrogenase large subunit [Oceanicola granulosus HTCC2516]